MQAFLQKAGQADEAIPLFQSLLAKKDSFYRALSISQTNEIYQMRNMDNLLLEKEQYKAMVHYAGLTLIAIALLILIPSTIRIYYVRKKLRKEEEEIRKMSQIAEEANEVKSRFLVNMSYNIRIPLNNVLGFSQLMTTDPESMDADQWKEYSEIIQTNSAELIQLVNDVLDLSRLEAGRTKWQIQEHEIISLCSDVLGMVRMRCGDKIQADFHTEIESQPFQVDTARFTQLILSTLIYTDPCEEKRKVSLYLERDTQRELFVFRVVNSPLADPALQTQKAEVRHSINRLTIEYFKGTYTIEPNTPEGPVLTSHILIPKQIISNHMTKNLITRKIQFLFLIGAILLAPSIARASAVTASVDSLQNLLQNDTDAGQRAIIYIHSGGYPRRQPQHFLPILGQSPHRGRKSQRRIYDEARTR